MHGLISNIAATPGWVVCLLVGLVVFAEDALFVGFVIPGETAALAGGAAASLGHVPLLAVLVTVIVAAIGGDSVGYEVGRVFGARLVGSRVMVRHQVGIEAAQDLLRRRGGVAVFLGRWTAFFRAVMPALAGTVRMPYRRFLVFNAAGGVLWAVAVVLAGYVAGSSYEHLASLVGRWTGAAAALVVVAGLVWWLRRRRDRR